MWLAIVLACTNPSALSCVVYAKEDEIFITKQECEVETKAMAARMNQLGAFARPSCIKVGTSI
jgi:hypothetical protein